MSIEIPVPDIGDFESVEIIEILVKAGDTINKNDAIALSPCSKQNNEITNR